MRGLHLSPISISKMRRIKKFQRDDEWVSMKIETERSTFDEVEITKISQGDDGKGWVSFWGLDYRGYLEWHIEIERIERLTIE